MAYRKRGHPAHFVTGKYADRILRDLSKKTTQNVVDELFEEILNSDSLSKNTQNFIRLLVDVILSKKGRSLFKDSSLDPSNAAETLYFIERLEQLEKEGKLKT